MSTFCGLMQEYRLISIDRFDGINLESTVYMLSHNHSDHTVGMLSADFQYRLLSNHRLKLYCSSVTRDLLLLDSRHQTVQRSIVALDINIPQLIDIPDPDSDKARDQVTVTLLQAGHCPGSVMFLFEGHEGTVLYTGDFRLSKQDFMNFDHLKSGTRVKSIKSVYVDTTFCIPQAMYIPSREECTDAAISLIREWLSRGSNYIVLLQYRADIGYENLFIRFSIEFKMKIHVDSEKFKQYEKLGDMANYVTTDVGSTRIHACRNPNLRAIKADLYIRLAEWCGRNAQAVQPQVTCTTGQRAYHGGGQLPCSLVNDGSRVRKLLFSTMCFVNRVALDDYVIRINDGFCRVCYSFHSSYSEIRDAILFLRPQRAFPNVVASYQDGEDEQRMQRRLDEFVQLAQRCDQSLAPSSYCGLGQLRKAKRLKTVKRDECASNQLAFGDNSFPYKDVSPMKKSPPCLDSIDFLADLLDNRRSRNSLLEHSQSDKTEFRLLFGSPVKSHKSSIASNDGTELMVDVQEDESVDSSYERTHSESVDICGSLEGMTQDDQDAIKNYAAESKPVLFYLSEGENGACRVEQAETREETFVKTTEVQCWKDGRLDNDDIGNALEGNCENQDLQGSTEEHLYRSPLLTATECGKRGISSELDIADIGAKENLVDTHPCAKKRKFVKDVNEANSAKLFVDPKKFSEKTSVTNLDVIVIADEDEAKPVSVAGKSLDSTTENNCVRSLCVDSDATTADVSCSPFKSVVSSTHKSRLTKPNVLNSRFDSDATTVDNTSPVNLVSPLKVSDGSLSDPPKILNYACSTNNNVSSVMETSSSADDLFIYLDSPHASETCRWASWSSVQATCSTGAAAQSSSARKKRKCGKVVESTDKTEVYVKPGTWVSNVSDDDSDSVYEADSESELNELDDNEVYSPVLHSKLLPLSRRVSPPTSSDSDDVRYDCGRKLVFDRSLKRSPCSSPWSSWSNEDVRQGQNSMARLCGSDNDAQDRVVLISDDDVEEDTTAHVSVNTSGCARMLNAEELSSTVPSCCQVFASGHGKHSLSCAFAHQPS